MERVNKQIITYLRSKRISVEILPTVSIFHQLVLGSLNVIITKLVGGNVFMGVCTHEKGGGVSLVPCPFWG